MALIPAAPAASIGQAGEIKPAAEQTTRTYKIDFASGRVAGFVDGREAMEQAIFKILATERFAHLIYSWGYGVEQNAVLGKSWRVFASELRRVVREALLADSRITDVTDFDVEQIDRRTAAVRFTAKTIFGDVAAERTITNV